MSVCLYQRVHMYISIGVYVCIRAVCVYKGVYACTAWDGMTRVQYAQIKLARSAVMAVQGLRGLGFCQWVCKPLHQRRAPGIWSCLRVVAESVSSSCVGTCFA